MLHTAHVHVMTLRYCISCAFLTRALHHSGKAYSLVWYDWCAGMEPNTWSRVCNRSSPTEHVKCAVFKRAIVHSVRRDNGPSEGDCYKAVFTNCTGVTDVWGLVDTRLNTTSCTESAVQNMIKCAYTLCWENISPVLDKTSLCTWTTNNHISIGLRRGKNEQYHKPKVAAILDSVVPILGFAYTSDTLYYRQPKCLYQIPIYLYFQILLCLHQVVHYGHTKCAYNVYAVPWYTVSWYHKAYGSAYVPILD